MNKLLFRFVILLMTISLLGIIAVQVYLINASFKNKEKKSGDQLKQVLIDVVKKGVRQRA